VPLRLGLLVNGECRIGTGCRRPGDIALLNSTTAASSCASGEGGASCAPTMLPTPTPAFSAGAGALRRRLRPNKQPSLTGSLEDVHTGKRPPAPMGARGRRTSRGPVGDARREPARRGGARGKYGGTDRASHKDRPYRDESARLAHDKPPHALRPRDGAERFWLSASLGDAQAVVKVALGLVKAGAENVSVANDFCTAGKR
jgi:hypothetical protein